MFLDELDVGCGEKKRERGEFKGVAFKKEVC